jgi:hypothetical protein
MTEHKKIVAVIFVFLSGLFMVCSIQAAPVNFAIKFFDEKGARGGLLLIVVSLYAFKKTWEGIVIVQIKVVF